MCRRSSGCSGSSTISSSRPTRGCAVAGTPALIRPLRRSDVGPDDLALDVVVRVERRPVPLRRPDLLVVVHLETRAGRLAGATGVDPYPGEDGNSPRGDADDRGGGAP